MSSRSSSGPDSLTSNVSVAVVQGSSKGGPQQYAGHGGSASFSTGNSTLQSRGRKEGGSRGACVHCKSLKVRCSYSQGETRCQRCISGGHECLARRRKKRKAAPTQDDLQERSRQQDQQIELLLSQFNQLQMNAKINRWIEQAKQCLNNGGVRGRPVRPITCHYYSSLIGPLNLDISPSNSDFERLPLLVKTGILEPYEILDLFNLHFERINPFFPLLDGEIHCPQVLVWKSHFLFTAICACASRHYAARPGLHEIIMEIARDAAGVALSQGTKTVETVQAFLLLAVHLVPEKRWAENRSWIFMGAAIRIALEIGLNKAPNTGDELENINRVRTWIHCFCTDKSHSAQFGKLGMIEADDYLVRTSVRTWWRSAKNSPYDIGLCAFAELLLLSSRFQRDIGTADALAQKFLEGFDVVALAMDYDKQLADLSSIWNNMVDNDPNVLICPVIRYRSYGLRLTSCYLRLAVLSIGFQYAAKTGISRDSYILQTSITIAQSAIRVVTDHMFPFGFLGWALEMNYLYMAFSAAFLLNLLRPKFLPLLTTAQCASSVELVQKLITILGSNDVSLDRKHSPALYSRFLSGLLDKYYTASLQRDINDASSVNLIQPQPTHAQTPTDIFSWPDVSGGQQEHRQNELSPSTGSSSVMFHHDNDAEMDFSISHLLRSAESMAPMIADVPRENQYEVLGWENLQHWQKKFPQLMTQPLAAAPIPTLPSFSSPGLFSL